jgi:thiol-disulfide isomerase/thioredoxin
VLVFFASWCSPCQGEISKLAAFVATHRVGAVEVLGIDESDKRPAAQKFTSEDHVTFRVALDPNNTITAGLFNFVTPSDTVFLNANGVVENVHFGLISVAQFASGIKSLEG